jgi:hypothetical protein
LIFIHFLDIIRLKMPPGMRARPMPASMLPFPVHLEMKRVYGRFAPQFFPQNASVDAQRDPLTFYRHFSSPPAAESSEAV